MQRTVRTTTHFDKDVRHLKRSGKYDLGELNLLMEKITSGQRLTPGYRDKQMKGKFAFFRDCHLAFDWVLIYKLDTDSVTFVRTGTHADLGI